MVTSGLPPSSGQPSSSATPFQISALSGHLSTSFSNVSPSRSVLGQPLRVGSVEGSPATFGQASSRSAMPSLSLSGSGQPSSSWKPSLSSACVGHLSIASGMPSPSVSFAGQPLVRGSLVATPFSFGHASSLSSTPSPSASSIGQPFFFGSDDCDALHVRAGVLLVDDAVVVVVDLGAAVGVLEAVAVLGDLGAAVDVVADAVVIEVVLARRPAEADDAAEDGHADRLSEADLAADEQERVAVVTELDAIARAEEHGRERRAARVAAAERTDRTRGEPAVRGELPALAIARVDAEDAGAHREADRPRDLVAEAVAARLLGRPRAVLGAQLVAEARLRRPRREACILQVRARRR